MLLLAVLVLTLNGATVHRVTAVGPYDETNWIDHLVRGAQFEDVVPGELMQQESLRELCSRGWLPYRVWPPCPSGPIDGRDYVFKGLNISSGPGPLYFLTTGPLARALRATPLDLSPNDSLVTWGRLLGSAWLLLGFYLTLRAGELLGVRRRSLVLGLGFVIATPALLHISTVVSPDQTALPSGAAVLLAGLSWERRGRGLWLVVLSALVGAALDAGNAVGILLVVIYLALRAVERRRGADTGTRRIRSYAGAIVALVVTVFAVSRYWSSLVDWLHDVGVWARPHVRSIRGNPVEVAVHSVGPTLSRAFGGTTPVSMFPPFRDTNVPPLRATPAYGVFSAFARIVGIGVLMATLFRDRLRGRVAMLGVATVVTLLVSPTLIILRDWIQYGTFYQPVARFGLSAIPALVILVGATCDRTRSAWVVVAGVGLGLYLSALVPVLL